jgi:hypothetical protein
MQHLALRMTSAFQLISRKVLWKVTVLCQLEDNQFKVPKRKFLALYATTNFGYYILADGSTLIVTIKEGVTQGCNFGTIVQPGLRTAGAEPLQEEFEGKPVKAACIHDDSGHLGDPNLVCEMLTRSQAYICKPDACRTALKWDHMPRWLRAQ